MNLWLPHIAILLLATGAAITDSRWGRIPNSLTLPPLIAAPVAYYLVAGPAGLLGSALGALLCGFCPFLLFRRGALGGGDVKLFAAIGAIAGFSVGLEAQLFGLIVAAVFVTVRLAIRRELLPVLGNAARLVANPLLPRRLRRAPTRVSLAEVRLGASILVGTLLAVLGQHGVFD